jgi:hypothetical protein
MPKRKLTNSLDTRSRKHPVLARNNVKEEEEEEEKKKGVNRRMNRNSV